jgi:hypothetical protein
LFIHSHFFIECFLFLNSFNEGAALVANSNTTTRGKLSGLFFGFFQTSFVAGNFCAFLLFYFNIQSFVLFLGFVGISALGSFLFLLMRESKLQHNDTVTSKYEDPVPEKYNKTVKEMIETFKLLKVSFLQKLFVPDL